VALLDARLISGFEGDIGINGAVSAIDASPITLSSAWMALRCARGEQGALRHHGRFFYVSLSEASAITP
jgi:hypothetical protein